MKDNDHSHATNNNYKVAAAAGNATMQYTYTVMQLTVRGCYPVTLDYF